MSILVRGATTALLFALSLTVIASMLAKVSKSSLFDLSTLTGKAKEQSEKGREKIKGTRPFKNLQETADNKKAKFYREAGTQTVNAIKTVAALPGISHAQNMISDANATRAANKDDKVIQARKELASNVALANTPDGSTYIVGTNAEQRTESANRILKTSTNNAEINAADTYLHEQKKALRLAQNMEKIDQLKGSGDATDTEVESFKQMHVDSKGKALQVQQKNASKIYDTIGRVMDTTFGPVVNEDRNTAFAKSLTDSRSSSGGMAAATAGALGRGELKIDNLTPWKIWKALLENSIGGSPDAGAAAFASDGAWDLGPEVDALFRRGRLKDQSDKAFRKEVEKAKAPNATVGSKMLADLTQTSGGDIMQGYDKYRKVNDARKAGGFTPEEVAYLYQEAMDDGIGQSNLLGRGDGRLDSSRIYVKGLKHDMGNGKIWDQRDEYGLATTFKDGDPGDLDIGSASREGSYAGALKYISNHNVSADVATGLWSLQGGLNNFVQTALAGGDDQAYQLLGGLFQAFGAKPAEVENLAATLSEKVGVMSFDQKRGQQQKIMKTLLELNKTHKVVTRDDILDNDWQANIAFKDASGVDTDKKNGIAQIIDVNAMTGFAVRKESRLDMALAHAMSEFNSSKETHPRKAGTDTAWNGNGKKKFSVASGNLGDFGDGTVRTDLRALRDPRKVDEAYEKIFGETALADNQDTHEKRRMVVDHITAHEYGHALVKASGQTFDTADEERLVDAYARQVLGRPDPAKAHDDAFFQTFIQSTTGDDKLHKALSVTNDRNFIGAAIDAAGPLSVHALISTGRAIDAENVRQNGAAATGPSFEGTAEVMERLNNSIANMPGTLSKAMEGMVEGMSSLKRAMEQIGKALPASFEKAAATIEAQFDTLAPSFKEGLKEVMKNEGRDQKALSAAMAFSMAQMAGGTRPEQAVGMVREAAGSAMQSSGATVEDILAIAGGEHSVSLGSGQQGLLSASLVGAAAEHNWAATMAALAPSSSSQAAAHIQSLGTGAGYEQAMSSIIGNASDISSWDDSHVETLLNLAQTKEQQQMLGQQIGKRWQGSQANQAALAQKAENPGGKWRELHQMVVESVPADQKTSWSPTNAAGLSPST